jgi:hypothetical protein
LDVGGGLVVGCEHPANPYLIKRDVGHPAFVLRLDGEAGSLREWKKEKQMQKQKQMQMQMQIPPLRYGMTKGGGAAEW